MDRYWTFEELYRRYSEVNLKIAEDSNGSKLRIPMKYFLEYLVYNQDDSPLYLFERYIIKQIIKTMFFLGEILFIVIVNRK